MEEVRPHGGREAGLGHVPERVLPQDPLARAGVRPTNPFLK
jgi:hypothetical protein